MPAVNLPTFSRAEVETHHSESSCFVLLGRNVYDISDFVADHPGGAGLVLDYAGKDVTDILKDEASHAHSEAAYEILDDSLVGFLQDSNKSNGVAGGKAGDNVNGVNGHANGHAEGKTGGTEVSDKGMIKDENGNWVHPRTGLACVEDLSKETNYNEDYKTHKFLDLSKPLFSQVFFGGFSKDFYLDQVHRPRHFKGGKSAPLFGNFLEPFSLTPWWLIPAIWLPPVCYNFYWASQGFSSMSTPILLFVSGFGLWSLVEYTLHRLLFHIDDYLPDNRFGITAHFLLHGIHHYLPMDKYRLVMPPVLFAALATPFWQLALFVFRTRDVAASVFCGAIFGYIQYDLTHYFLHHQNLPLWYKDLKKYHLAHHFIDYELGFGVTSKFWDKVFGTELIHTVKMT